MNFQNSIIMSMCMFVQRNGYSKEWELLGHKLSFCFLSNLSIIIKDGTFKYRIIGHPSMSILSNFSIKYYNVVFLGNYT